MNQNRRSAKLSPAQIKKLLIILALVAAVLTALVLVLRTRVKQQFGREEAVSYTHLTLPTNWLV